jgi:hypothetical protein
MTRRELEEYRALRATIRERGTARVWVFVTGLGAWAALVVATAALASLPVATLLPLLFLAAVFEAVFALHTGVERIGRYIQVFYEEASERGWEQTAMAFGRAFPARGSDPVFAPYFWVAIVFNFVPALLAGAVRIEWTVVGIAHVIVAARIALARWQSARQRVVELQHFLQLKQQSGISSQLTTDG